MDLLALVVAAVVAFVVVLALFQRALGGEKEGGNRQVALILDRLPRPLRDETFYEELRPDGRTLLAAALIVAVVGAAIMLPLAGPDLSGGQVSGGLQRLAGGAVGGLIVWLALCVVAYLASRIGFGRRPPWRKLLAGLGFALSPLLLAALWANAFGFWIVFVAVSAAFLLCYIAVRANVPSDPVPLMGVTLSMFLSGMAIWVLAQLSCVFCVGFSITGCPSNYPVRAYTTAEGGKTYVLPGNPQYDQVNAEHCFINVRTAEDAGFRAQ